MKKIFALALAASMMAGAANAQEAFKHLGISVEVGTTGAGVNISYPIVTDHVILTLGYNLPTYVYKTDFDLNGDLINGRIASANSAIDAYNKVINDHPNLAQAQGLNPLDRIDNVSSINTAVEAEINFVNYKAFLELYPTTKSAFHFTVGAFYGNGEWVNIGAQADPTVWGVYKKAVDQNKTIPTVAANSYGPGVPATDIHPVEGLEDAAVFNLNGQTFRLDPEHSNGHLDTKLTVRKLKPYVGIGFGSSVPTRKRVGCQLELGAYYHGKPSIVSEAEVEYNPNAFSSSTVDDVLETITKFRWYPQMTLRITGRLF